jgi:hypothetical protein
MREGDGLEGLRAELDGIARVEAVEGLVVRAYVGDAVPAVGEALRIGDACHARVMRHLGQRRVEALLLSAHEAAQVGALVSPTGQAARFPAPDGDRLALGVGFVTEGGLSWDVVAPGWLALDPARPALLLGDDVLDTLCPLAARGTNLVVDARRAPDAFEALTGHALEALGADEVFVLSREGELTGIAGKRVEAGQAGLVAWRALVSWACAARDAGRSVAVVGTLEIGDRRAGQGAGMTLGQVVELLGERLVSTRTGTITTFLRLKMPADGLEELGETLGLGDVDAQLMLLASGRVDARRSRSRAELDEEGLARRAGALSALTEAEALAERQRLFGADELSDAERALVEEARRWR